jgi:hypothetical protein
MNEFFAMEIEKDMIANLRVLETNMRSIKFNN